MKKYAKNIKLLGLFSTLFLCIGIAQAEKQLILGPITIASTYGGKPQTYFPEAEVGKSSKVTIIIANLPDDIENRKLNQFTDEPVVLYFQLQKPDGTMREYKRCGAYTHTIGNDEGFISYFEPQNEELIMREMGQYLIRYRPTSATVTFTPANSTLLPASAATKGLSPDESIKYKILENKLELANEEMKWINPNKSSEHKQPGKEPTKTKSKSDECAIS